jgi:hypothetical protein
MRSAGKPHPEWGYLAPQPSLLRTMRITLVATAIGATAGAGVVMSLVQRSTADVASMPIASHALITAIHTAPADAATATLVKASPSATAPVPAPMSPQPGNSQTPPTGGPEIDAGANQASTASPLQGPAPVAALADRPVSAAAPARARDETAVPSDAGPMQQPAMKKRHSAGSDERRGQSNGNHRRWARNNFGTLLRHLFRSRRGRSHYPN